MNTEIISVLLPYTVHKYELSIYAKLLMDLECKCAFKLRYSPY